MGMRVGCSHHMTILTSQVAPGVVVVAVEEEVAAVAADGTGGVDEGLSAASMAAVAPLLVVEAVRDEMAEKIVGVEEVGVIEQAEPSSELGLVEMGPRQIPGGIALLAEDWDMVIELDQGQVQGQRA